MNNALVELTTDQIYRKTIGELEESKKKNSSKWNTGTKKMKKMERVSVHWRTSSGTKCAVGISLVEERGSKEYYFLNDGYYKCIDPGHSINSKHKSMKTLYEGTS